MRSLAPVLTEPLRDQVVLVTGASRGIGAGTARGLVAAGARVALVGLEGPLLERLALELGPQALWMEADVTDFPAMERAVALTLERFGRLDCVIANAGIGLFSTLTTVKHSDFARVLEVNVMGTWNIMSASLPALIQSKGYFLGIASGAAGLPIPGMNAYSASKAAVESLCDTMRMEMAHHHVRVGVAYFSFMDTDLVGLGRQHPGLDKVRAGMPPVLGRIYPVGQAVQAILKGVRRRSARIVTPRALGVFLAFRWLLNWLLPYRTRAYLGEVEQLCRDSVHLQRTSEHQ